jgi:lipid A ethanolaminephosphotransferase
VPWASCPSWPQCAALFIASLGLMVAGISLALLALGAWRRSIKPLATLLLAVAAIGAHFMGSYRIVIDPTMMFNVLHTDMHEASDLIGWRLMLSLVLIAGQPAWWLWRTPLSSLPAATQGLYNTAALTLGLSLAGALLVLNAAPMSSTLRNHKSLRYMINPANSFYALSRLAVQRSARPSGPPQAIGADAQLHARREGARPPLLMLVVGETARADHFALNGYRRNTSPDTAALGLVSFTHVSACGTTNAASLPCMFSHLGSEGFGARTQDQANLLDLLQRAGLAVLWIDNQAGCKGLCERVPNATARAAPPGMAHAPGLCRDGECLDGALLAGLEQCLAALPEARRQRGVVLVLHPMGSHGPAYYKRSPAAAKRFLPECQTHALQDCDKSALINAYDNSIAYTDRVLAQSIDWLSRQAGAFDPMRLYVSDHGESLGENNMYLHGMPYALAPREQTHVPMLMWLPPQTEAATGITRACLQQRRDLTLTHDHLFHTVLGLVGVNSSLLKPTLDLTAPCRNAWARRPLAAPRVVRARAARRCRGRAVAFEPPLREATPCCADAAHCGPWSHPLPRPRPRCPSLPNCRNATRARWRCC